MNKKSVGVLVSGRGSNLKVIIDNINSGYLPLKIGVVVSDKPDVLALDVAKNAGIPAFVIERKEYENKESFEDALLKKLFDAKVDLVVLAGFMRILSPFFIKNCPFQIMNIHPALLPSFVGLNAQQQALDYGVKISGCTVHFVDEGMDTGPIILQKAVNVEDDDTEDSLSKKIIVQEHKAYSEALKLWCEGSINVVGRKVIRKKTFI